MGAAIANPDEATGVVILKARLTRALAALPERQRSAVILRWEQELSNREIAQASGLEKQR